MVGSPGVMRRARCDPCECLHTAAITGPDSERYSGPHAPDAQASTPAGLPDGNHIFDCFNSHNKLILCCFVANVPCVWMSVSTLG